MILAALFACLIANCVYCERVLVNPLPGEIVPVDISVNAGDLTMVSGTAYPPLDGFAQSINFYDFEKQMEARKVVDEDVCYVRKFTATLDQIMGALDGTESEQTIKVVEELNIRGKEIKENELTATVGAKIARFCSGYAVFWLAGGEEGNQVEVRMTKRKFDWALGGNLGIENGSVSGSLSFQFSGSRGK